LTAFRHPGIVAPRAVRPLVGSDNPAAREVSPLRFFVTGAGGFLGGALAGRLRADGHDVSGVDLTAGPGVLAGDVTRPGNWETAVAGCDVVVHTAALVSNVPSIDEAWRANTLGTRRVLDAAVRGGASRFVYLSSVRAFSDLGFPDGVTEDHPVRPDGNSYVDSRIATEQVVLQAHAAGEIPVTIVRPGDTYGPRSRPWTLLPLELIKGNRFLLPAMGRGIFSPVYVDDLVDGLARAATHDAAAGQVFTIGGGVGVECRAFFGHYYRMLGKAGPPVFPTPVALAMTGAVAGVARLARVRTEINPTGLLYFTRTGTYSIEKAGRLLGYHPAVDLAEGMRRTEAWLAAEGLIPRRTAAGHGTARTRA
jgi:nucleoside-diphosphate-sugar epimerase